MALYAGRVTTQSLRSYCEVAGAHARRGSFLSPRARPAQAGRAGARGTYGGTTRVPSVAIHRPVASR
jgi:hypothetical protein